jgi:hypothetical protein
MAVAAGIYKMIISFAGKVEFQSIKIISSVVSVVRFGLKIAVSEDF